MFQHGSQTFFNLHGDSELSTFSFGRQKIMFFVKLSTHFEYIVEKYVPYG